MTKIEYQENPEIIDNLNLLEKDLKNLWQCISQRNLWKAEDILSDIVEKIKLIDNYKDLRTFSGLVRSIISNSSYKERLWKQIIEKFNEFEKLGFDEEVKEEIDMFRNFLLNIVV